MRYLSVLTVLLAATVGVFLYGTMSPGARAAPPIQQREDQITIYSAGSFNGSAVVGAWESYRPLGGDLRPIRIGLDASDYPTSTTFRLEDVSAESGNGGCVRLFDLTANAPVTTSEVCHGGVPGITVVSRNRSAQFTLPAGEHEYTVEGKGDTQNIITAMRIIAEWTERR